MKKRYSIIIIILLVILLGGGVWFGLEKNKKEEAKKQETEKQEEVAKAEKEKVSKIDTSDWQTFSSKTEGFTIKYPNNWKIYDTSSGNCGHNELAGSRCRERFDFISPDGIMVRYLIGGDENIDKSFCVQAVCVGVDVLGIEKVSINNFGEAFLIKTDQSVFLHKPISDDTMPVLGNNYNSKYDIAFGMPSKTGGRYEIFIMTERNLNEKKFYDLRSAKEAIEILKSLSY